MAGHWPGVLAEDGLIFALDQQTVVLQRIYEDMNIQYIVMYQGSLWLIIPVAAFAIPLPHPVKNSCLTSTNAIAHEERGRSPVNYVM